MHDQLRKDVYCKVLGGVYVIYIPIDEKNKTVKKLLHNFIKGAFVTVKKTAVATGAVIHWDPS